MARLPVARIFFTMFSMQKKWCLNRCRNNIRSIKIACCVLLCALVPFNIMFYTRGCRHTKILFNPDRADSFRHGHPPQLPSHFFTQAHFGREAGGGAGALLGAPVAPLAHVVWCSDGPFQFQHYLAVLSAYKLLKPTLIHFHYHQLPEMDADGYYQFFSDLQRDLPNLVVQPVSSSAACSGDVDTKLGFILQLLNQHGGIFVGESVMLAESLSALRQKRFAAAYNASAVHVVLMERGFLDSQASGRNVEQLLQGDGAARFSCARDSAYRISVAVPCVAVSRQTFPVDVWELDSDFGQLARWVAHGRTELLRPQPSNSSVVPNVVHYVWLGDRPLKYFSYLSLLSALYVLQADMVYIHGDIEPHGPHWNAIRAHRRVTFVKREFPGAIFAEPIVKFASHASDYWRGDLLVRYGGVYMDWDVIWVKPIPEELRRYETVACADFPATGAFPDVFNLGVVLAQRGSAFLRFFLESYHHYLDSHWSYNAIHMPYKVYEKHPDLLFVNRHLQVICAKGLCHPVWNPRFKDPEVHHLSSSPFDWKTDTLAVHWTYPDPEEFASEQALSESISMFASIAKYVLRKAEHHLQKELTA